MYHYRSLCHKFIYIQRKARLSVLSIIIHHLLPNAAGLVGQSFGASNLLERNAWVIRVLEPIEPPLATWLELLREAFTLGAGGDTAVLLAPSVGWRTELCSAGVENAYATTRNSEIEVVVSQVAASVGGLHDHLLA